MGTFYCFCAICAGQPNVGRQTWENRDTKILWDGSQTWPEDCPIPVSNPREFTSLIFDEFDLDYQQRIALVGPIRSPIILEPPPLREELTDISLADIRAWGGVRMGMYGDKDSSNEVETTDNTVYMMVHETCLRLVNSSFSRLGYFKLWGLFKQTHTQEYADTPSLLRGVDYYEIMGSMEQFVWPWFGIRGPEMQAAFRKVQRAPNQLAALRSVLLKDGHIFVFSAPDRFPINEATARRRVFIEPHRSANPSAKNPISSLPVELLVLITVNLSAPDILALLLTNSIIRANLLSILDWCVKQDIDVNAPWMLPHTAPEMTKWKEDAGEISDSFPWFVYRWACEEYSPSMLNRKRIWKVLKQMEAMAEGMGVL